MTAEEFEGASLAAVLDAVDLMDGGSRSLVTLTDAAGSVMIGGGPLHFICTADYGNSIVNVLSDGSMDEFTSLVVGGQRCDYPRGYVLDKEVIERVARGLMQCSSLAAIPGTKLRLWQVSDQRLSISTYAFHVTKAAFQKGTVMLRHAREQGGLLDTGLFMTKTLHRSI